jgi:hypothetical protein
MRWFRFHRNSVTWLACFALACQLVLSFGHIHLGKFSNGFHIGSLLAGVAADAVGGKQPDASHPAKSPSDNPSKGPSNLAEDTCAVCRTIHLADTLVLPGTAAIDIPYAFAQRLTLPAEEAEPSAPAHAAFQARGPPQA